MAKNDNFIDTRKKFIAQFDSLKPTNGSEAVIKSLAEQYKSSLEDLDEQKNKLIDLFKLGNEVDIEKLQKKEKYPFEIGAYHLGLASFFGLSAFSFFVC